MHPGLAHRPPHGQPAAAAAGRPRRGARCPWMAAPARSRAGPLAGWGLAARRSVPDGPLRCCHAVRGRRFAADQPAAHWPASHDAASRTAWRRHGSGGWGACRQARPAGSAAPLCGQPAAGRCRWPAASWSSLPASSSSPRTLGWLGWVATWPVPAAASAAVAAKALRPTSCRSSPSLRWPATRRTACVRCSELVLGLGRGPPMRSTRRTPSWTRASSWTSASAWASPSAWRTRASWWPTRVSQEGSAHWLGRVL